MKPRKPSRQRRGARSLRCAVLWASLLVLVVCAAGRAQPRTMYKPADIENARRNVQRYPWARSLVQGWKSRAAFALEQDRAFFEDLIPELTPGTHYGQTCPACVDPAQRRGARNLTWSVRDPDRLTCRDCGTVYPNEAYPETGVLELPQQGQTLTYYQTPEERALPPEATDAERAEHALLGINNLPAMNSMSGLTRYYRARWAWNEALNLAKLYAVTEDVAYAERALWILDRFAQVFPNYLYKSYVGSWADGDPAEVAANMGDPGTPRGGRLPPDTVRHPYGLPAQHTGEDEQGPYSTLYNGFWGAGRLSCHGMGSDAFPLLYLTKAYDLTRDAHDSGGRPVADAAMHRRIVTDLIEAGCADYDHWDDLSNKGVATRSLSAAVGVLLEQPGRVRRALEGFEQVLASRYHFDGFYSESPAYARHNYLSMRHLPEILYGYSDPPGYQPEEGPRLENLDLFSDGHFHLALLAMVRMLAPGNLKPVIGNSRPGTPLGTRYAEVLAARLGGPYAGLRETLAGQSLDAAGSEYLLWYGSPELQTDAPTALPVRSEWFPGWHVGVLRGGRSDTALYLVGDEHRWTLRTGHRHADTLHLSYYAFGEELVSDRGYYSGSAHRTPDGRLGQRWTSGTLSHNLVVVDEANQSGAPRGSHLELFGSGPGVEMIQASGFGGYPQCSEYRRTCAQVRGPDGNHYVVDFFRVAGGRTHQYTFHANGRLVDWCPAEPALQSVELSEAWSQWVERPRGRVPAEPATFTWNDRDVNLDLMLLNQETLDRIVVADAPGWRRHAEALEGREPIQQILAERHAGDEQPLASRYAAVIVPYTSETTPVVSARLLVDDAESGAMAVEVRFAERTDYLISAKDSQLREYGPVTAAGEFAFVSVDEAGQVLQAYLLAGTLLEHGDTRIELAEATTRLRVDSVAERTFHLAEPLTERLGATARFVLADGPTPLDGETPRPRTGFDVEAVSPNTITVRDYPVQPSDEVTLLHATWRDHREDKHLREN